MKGLVLSVIGAGGIGVAAYSNSGASMPDDYVGHVNKAPHAVYAAFSALGTEGETMFPGKDGWGGRVTQRIVKVPDEQVKIELLVDDEALITAEVQMAPEEGGTRLAAELDLNTRLLNRIVADHGGAPVPTFALQDYLMDQVFAQAMGEMVERIEEGRPLLSLAATQARWGNGGGGGSRPGRPAASASAGSWQQPEAARPQMDARPAIDPNAAARRHAQGR